MELTFSQLRKKEVVNVCDARSYGRVCDLLFTSEKGEILGIIVPGRRGFNIFKFKNEMYIEWCKIKKIGKDVILVDLRKGEERPKNDNCKNNLKIDMQDY